MFNGWKEKEKIIIQSTQGKMFLKFKENIEIDRYFFLICVLQCKKKYDNRKGVLTLICMHVYIFILNKLVVRTDKIVGNRKKILSERNRNIVENEGNNCR